MKKQSPYSSISRKIIGFYAFLFIVVFLCSHAGIQKQASTVADNHLCSVKSKTATGLIPVNEMLFSIKSFSLFDSEDPNSP